MADLIAIGYPDETTAFEAADEARRLAADLIIQPDAIAVITRDKDGTYHAHTSHHAVGGGALWGMFWGFLFGLLFFIPVFGLAVGAGMGALMGKFAKTSIDKQFQDQVRDMVQPGTSALFLMLEKVTPDKASEAMSKYGGTVLKTSLSKEEEKELQEALSGATAHRPYGPGTPPPAADPTSEKTRMGLTLLRLQAEAADPEMPQSNWVNRRVECLDFLDTRAVRRHVSVDFDVPADAPCILVGEHQFRLVPITNLPKGNLVTFDLRDEDGRALWLPTSDYSSDIVASTIAYFAKRILHTESLTSDLKQIIRKEPAEYGKEWAPFAAAAALIDAQSRYRSASRALSTISGWLRAIWSVSLRERLTWLHFRQLRNLQWQWARAQDRMNTATEDLRTARQAWSTIAADKRPMVWKLMEDEQFRNQLEELARNFVVLAAVTSPPKTRRIVKLTFESPITFRTPTGLSLRLMQSAGWRCWRADVPIGGRGGSHHLESAAPPGVDIVRIKVTPWEEGRPAKPISAPGGSPHVHVRVPGATPCRSRARIFLRVSRPGWLTISWLMALVIGAVMLAGRMRLSVIFATAPGQPPGSQAGTAATLLLALLGVIAAVLTRPGEHPLASRLLLLTRILILIDSAVVLSATGALVLHPSQRPVSGTLWTWLLVITLLVAALLTISRFLPVMEVPRGIRRLAAMLSIRRGEQ